jgi:hypothetical protein
MAMVHDTAVLGRTHRRADNPACRSEEEYRQIHAGASASEVQDDDARLVPIGCLLAVDTSLAPLLEPAVGAGMWRDDE